jgi:hypothetical protein
MCFIVFCSQKKNVPLAPQLFSKKRILLQNFVVIILIILSLTTLVGRLQLSVIRGSERSEWVKTQEWASEHTEISSIFLTRSGLDIYESWSTLSKRVRLMVDGEYASPYLYSKADDVFNKKRRLLPTAPPETSTALVQESFFNDFSEQFGGNYLVTTNLNTRLNYKIVYHNAKYVIYSLN